MASEHSNQSVNCVPFFEHETELANHMPAIFLTGGSGFIGSALIPALLERNLRVSALIRPGREACLPGGVEQVVGDALDASSYRDRVPHQATFVHLVGTPHPNPAKAAEFERVDLQSLCEAVRAAQAAKCAHFVYLSVAQPAPVMRAYVVARARGELQVRESGMAATFLRPWYVLGPGHRWPLMLQPFYTLARAFPATRAAATRLGLVARKEMVAALVAAVEHPPPPGEVRVVEVPQIRAALVRESGIRK
jgi:uncharacterized protein YbjT (DUF2867 family)